MNIRVRLNTDLTKYDNRLTIGIEGYAISNSRMGDRFVIVKFDTGACIDVLWDSLDIIDKNELDRIEKAKNEHIEKLKYAKNVILYKGPRGGFKGLSYVYPGGSMYDGFRDSAMRDLEIIKSYGIHVEEVIR